MSDKTPPISDDVPEQPKGRKEKPSGFKFWALLIGGISLILVLNWVREQTFAKELTFGEFVSGIENGVSEEFDPKAIYDLKIGRQYITFQDQPKKKTTNKSKTESPKSEEKPAITPKNDTASEESAKVTNYRIAIGGLPEQSIEALATKLQNNKIDYNGSSPQTDLNTIVTIVLLVSMMVLFVVFLKRMSGGGAAMSFGRSRGKLMADDDVKNLFSDVAGIEEAVDELREIVEFLRTPGKYQALGGRIPRGVLLVGPPGTGKTLLAKAVAGEAGVPFFSLSGSDFVEMFVGVGAARVRDMFSQAAQKAPSIIFIDELDALGKVRGNGLPGGHDEREQTLNALLVEMDGFASDESVIVMGATNRPETLDPALMRPGRFDRHVLVDRPDYNGREQILKVHSKKIKMDENVNLGRIAKLTPGFVGADLANLVNEAALLAARNGKSAVTMIEFEEGIERVIAGLEKSSRLIHEDEKLRVAYHESGHALVACSLPNTDPVHKISIIPRGFGALGYMMQRPEDDRHLITQSELESRICVSLGGIAAEELIFEETSTGASNDLEQATGIARRMVMEFGMSPKLGRVNYRESKTSPFLKGASTGVSDVMHSEETLREIDQEVKRIVDEAMKMAQETLATQRPLLEQITKELLEREVMSSEQLGEILKAHKTVPQLKHGTRGLRTSAPSTGEIETSSDLKQNTGE